MKPWDKEKRAQVKRKIDKEARRAADRLGAQGVMIIAFFKQGEYAHVLDGGEAPMPYEEVYKKMVTGYGVVKESGGEDVEVH